MDNRIKVIEDLSLNAWPSHQMQLYDGWILRFSHFYTHRTNCVEQIGLSSLPLQEKIGYCEEVYRDWGTPCIFKINPLVPSGFDSLLYRRGYGIEHVTDVMTLSLKQPYDDIRSRVILEDHISDKWISSLFAFKHTDNEIHRRIVPTMYAAIPKHTIAAHIEKDGRYAAMGLGILDRDQIGIYAIHVAPALRRQHLASDICRSILNEGIRHGVSSAYLQVVQGNTGARSLYESLGFSGLYTYWFRVSRSSDEGSPQTR